MLTIEIFNSGAAFDPDANAEAARILRDMNGNQAGTASIDPMTAHTE